MNKPRHVWLSVLGCGLLLAVLASFLFRFSPLRPGPSSEPKFAGQPLSVHLRNQTYGDVRIDRAAKEAIRDLGSNGVPFLVEILEARESRFRAAVRSLVQRQNLWRIHYTPLSVRQNEAALACETLGPTAAPAAPALRRLVNDPVLAPAAIAALAQIGPENLPFLMNLLQTGSDTARIHAAGHLRHLRPAHEVVPALMRALQDSHPVVRSRAAESLGTFADKAEIIVPALVASLDDLYPLVRDSAAQSLGWLGPDASSAAPKLLRKLHEQRDLIESRRIEEALKAVAPAAAESAGLK